MLILPVLDLKGGHAVHAVRGERARYQPVHGVLGRGEEPLTLALAFRERLGCSTLYVADLDAIAGLPGHVNLLRQLPAQGLQLWVDAGVSSVVQAEALLELGVAKVIVGSETLQTASQLVELAIHFPPARLVLSVDLIDGALQAPAEFASPTELLTVATAHELRSVIVLDLARVGASAGPPLDLIVSLRRSFSHLDFYAGGGVRDKTDLEALERAGARGALVATAFHQGILTADDLS